MMNTAQTSTLRPEIADTGRIRLGAGFKRLPVPSAAIADSGKIRLGAGFKHRRNAR